MIALIWAMLRARRIQALTVAVMALVAVAAAVSSAVFVDVARQRILADDLANASVDERSVTVWDTARLAARPGNQVEESQLAASRQRAFEANAPALVRADGFGTVYSVSYYSFLLDRPFQRPDEMERCTGLPAGFLRAHHPGAGPVRERARRGAGQHGPGGFGLRCVADADKHAGQIDATRGRGRAHPVLRRDRRAHDAGRGRCV